MQTIKKLTPLVCLGLMIATAATAAMTSSQVSTRIRNKINSKWKTTGLSISVVPYEGTQTSGRFKSISVSASSVTISDVKMTNVKLSASDVTLDLNQLVRRNEIVTTRRKTGHFSASVSPADLNKALAHKKDTIRDLKVYLGKGTLTFTGTHKYGLGAKLKLEGRLEVADKSKVNFVATKASVSGIPLPTSVLKGVLAKINPLLDFKTLPLSPRLEKVEVQPSGITFAG